MIHMHTQYTLINCSILPGSYFTDAEYDSSSMKYVWRSTTSNAYVFRDALTSATSGDCVAVDASGLRGEACSTGLSYICEKGKFCCDSGNG